MIQKVGKKVLLLGVLVLSVLCIAGCKAKNSKQLKRQARMTYGAAKVISETNGSDSSTVVMQDKLQGFEYTITSYTSPFVIDGTNFGDVAGTHSDFDTRLMHHCVGQVQSQIDSLCQQYNGSWECNSYFRRDLIGFVKVDDPNNAKVLSEGIAKALQTQNKKNRLDNVEISVEDNNDNYLGRVLFPGCTFESEAEKMLAAVTEYAKKLDPNAVYERTETKTLRQMGIPVETVIYTDGFNFPKEDDSQVHLYYFKGTGGKSFYVSDFTTEDDMDPATYEYSYHTNFK